MQPVSPAGPPHTPTHANLYPKFHHNRAICHSSTPIPSLVCPQFPSTQPPTNCLCQEWCSAPPATHTPSCKCSWRIPAFCKHLLSCLPLILFPTIFWGPKAQLQHPLSLKLFLSHHRGPDLSLLREACSAEHRAHPRQLGAPFLAVNILRCSYLLIVPSPVRIHGALLNLGAGTGHILIAMWLSVYLFPSVSVPHVSAGSNYTEE